MDKLTTWGAVDDKLADDIDELPNLDGLLWKELLRAGGVNGGGVDGMLETIEDTLGLGAELDLSWEKLPQTSSSQDLTTGELAAAAPTPGLVAPEAAPPATRLWKLIVPVMAALTCAPFVATVDRSSTR